MPRPPNSAVMFAPRQPNMPLPGRPRIHMRKRKNYTDYIFETVLVVTVVALLSHTIFNFTVKYTVHDQLTKMKDSLCTLKETIYSIDHAYENLQDDLAKISQIKGIDEKVTGYGNVELNDINDKVKKFNEVKEKISDMEISYDKQLREIYKRNNGQKKINFPTTATVRKNKIQHNRDDRVNVNRIQGNTNLQPQLGDILAI